jgi:hypothetical protein
MTQQNYLSRLKEKILMQIMQKKNNSQDYFYYYDMMDFSKFKTS